MKDDVEQEVDQEQEERAEQRAARDERVERPKVVTRNGIERDGVQQERKATRVPERSDSEPERLFEGDRARELKTRWTDVQAQFVDDPREAVKAADALVDEVIRDLSALFADERSGLEAHWSRDEEVSTEDLRQALRRYRSFFERLLSI